MEHDLEVKFAHPSQLTIHPRNPKVGNVEEIKQSLKASGQYRPIVVNRRSGFVVAGNHTLKAIRELGWGAVAYVEIDVNEQTERRIMLADNRTSDLGTYDHGLLLAELEAMEDDLLGTGYTDIDLDALRLLADDDPDIDDDDEGGLSAPARYGAVVEVATMEEQRRLLRELSEMGLDARPLTKE